MRQAPWISSAVFAASILALGVAGAMKIVDYRSEREAASTGQWEALIQGKAALAFESHYNNEFPAKTFGTNLWGAIDYALFHEGRPGVVIGRDHWLYTDEEFKTYADAGAQLEAHLKLLVWARDELARRGTQLAVAVLPAKTRVYPEYLASRRPATIHRDLYARIRQTLADARMPHADLLPALIAAKKQRPVFLRTDTHWTPWGAEVAAQEIARSLTSAGLAGAGTQPFRTITEAPRPHRGDLFNFLPLDPYFAFLLPPQEQIAVQRTEPLGAGAAALLGDAAEPAVTLVGTSYSANERWNFHGALQQALGEEVVNYAQQGKGPFIAMLDYLQSREQAAQPPRVVIWEVPERYFPVAYDLSAYAATLPPELVQRQTVAEPKKAEAGAVSDNRSAETRSAT